MINLLLISVNKMKDITRREFMKIAGICALGSLFYPEVASAKRVSKEIIKKILEPKLDPLTKKIIQIESNWDYWAKGKNGEIGLMQIQPNTLEEWNEHGSGRLYNKYDLFEPIVNVKIGKWYLHERIGEHYLPHYNLDVTDENKAASYNAGPVRIGEIGDAVKNFYRLPKKTQNYLRKLQKLS